MVASQHRIKTLVNVYLLPLSLVYECQPDTLLSTDMYKHYNYIYIIIPFSQTLLQDPFNQLLGNYLDKAEKAKNGTNGADVSLCHLYNW